MATSGEIAKIVEKAPILAGLFVPCITELHLYPSCNFVEMDQAPITYATEGSMLGLLEERLKSYGYKDPSARYWMANGHSLIFFHATTRDTQQFISVSGDFRQIHVDLKRDVRSLYIIEQSFGHSLVASGLSYDLKWNQLKDHFVAGFLSKDCASYERTGGQLSAFNAGAAAREEIDRIPSK